MNGLHLLAMAAAALIALSTAACTTREVTSGAAGGAAGYEYANKRAMDQLEEEYRAGRITREEYEQRKKEIESRSAVY